MTHQTIVGMTGNRDGMTKEQKIVFEQYLKDSNAGCLHHGDCVGADSDAHDIAESLSVRIALHPPIKEDLRAFKIADVYYSADTYFARNRMIVNESEFLVGFPKTFSETKGGTWYTINYGLKGGKPVIIIWPDGSMTWNGKVYISNA